MAGLAPPITGRLDGKGLLLVDPGDELKDTIWFGEASGYEIKEPEEDKKGLATLFESVMCGEELISVGDCIYLTPDEKDEPCEIAKVTAMYELDETAEKYLEVKWFWRPEHIDMVRAQRAVASGRVAWGWRWQRAAP